MSKQGVALRSASAAVVLFALTGIFGLAAGARADTCTCSVVLWSDYRWMSPWWGLECDGHCGHGYVGSSCDTAHGQGCGAMTGFVQLRHSSGAVFDDLDCPDNHITCFRGPSACDNGGSWGNTCSADIDHCIPGGNPSDAWDCNFLSHSERVLQAYAPSVTFPGACGTNWFNVFEHINENDPFCCDDPMGYLNVSTWTAEGSHSVSLSGSDTNCNGGSQGGVYPHCGSFGATLTVDMSCRTTVTSGGGGGGGGGEEPPPPPALQSNGLPTGAPNQGLLVGSRSKAAVRTAAVAGPVFQELLAVSESLVPRARKMAEMPRERVADEVAGRAFAFGVKAPVQDLTRLLIDAGWAELDLDFCRVETLGREGACRAQERRVKRFDAAFRVLSGGLAIREFRTGATLAGPLPEPAPPHLVRESE